MSLRLNIKIGLAVFLIVAFFVVANLTNFSVTLKNFFYLISSPLQQTFWKAGNSVSDFFGSIFEAKILQAENKKIYSVNQQLLVENLSLKELKKENDALRAALNLNLAKDFTLVQAYIVSKDVSQDSILINLGKKDAMIEGMPVITPEKILVGRIGKIYNNFSEVILISNKLSTFDAKIVGSDISGVIRGKGNGEFYFDLLPKDKEVLEGDNVITSALGNIFPQGLLVGNVAKVENSDLSVWQTATIKPAFQLKDLNILFVITTF